jgi:hypothetical protein
MPTGPRKARPDDRLRVEPGMTVMHLRAERQRFLVARPLRWPTIGGTFEARQHNDRQK